MKKKDSESTFAVTRRRFVATAAAVTSGSLLAGAMPFSLRAADCPAETLREIGSIKSVGGKLKGIIRITNARKTLPTLAGDQQPMMRYFEGLDQNVGSKSLWPPKGETGSLLPGPTLRVGIGELVQITLLNNVNVGAFSGLTLDAAEEGKTDGCDQATNQPPPAKVGDPLPKADTNWYPGTRGDTFPNCYHASSSANLHFHGTHVTPDAFGDNVILSLRPNPKLKAEDVAGVMDEVFAQCEQHPGPVPWDHVPESFRTMQEKLTREYDLNAIWKGTRGPVKDAQGNDVPALPVKNQLTPANAEAVAEGHWPPYFVGAYPSCFKVTEAAGNEMGQSPGTHWYHAHKHGSTSINLFNGMAGVMIITGQYDAQLKGLYPKLKEKVMIIQRFTDQPNLELGTNRPRTTTNNGTRIVAGSTTAAQVAPTILMQPGEIQLWRIVNGQVQGNIAAAKFSGPKQAVVSAVPVFRQIAQDGVQFNHVNYNDQPLTSRDPNTGNGTQFDVVPGGRIDILVQAPLLASGTTSASFELAGVVNVTVCGDAVDNKFPDGSTAETYLTFPPFLGDVSAPPDPDRHLSFDWEPFRLKNGPAAQGATHSPTKTMPFPVTVDTGSDAPKEIIINTSRGPYWMIDNEQFRDGKYYQTMILGDSEEWKIVNTTSVAHPFHIHINPFQVVEVFDPNAPTNPAKTYKREKNGVWHDVVMIPAAKTTGGLLDIDTTTGKSPEANWGYIRVRSRFVDFPGTFVLHCHILGHEDRGMMQLVRVISGATTIQHH